MFALITWSALDNYWRESHLPVFDVNRHRLYALRRRGSGQKVLMIHGLAASSVFWQDVIAQLPPEYDVLAPDLLGFGQSPKPSANYDLHDQVEATIALMRRQYFLDGQPVILLAHSMGVLVAMALAAADPDKFALAVFVSTPCYPDIDSARKCLSKVSFMHQGVLQRSRWTKLMCFTLHGRKWPNIGGLFGIPNPVFTSGGLHTWESLSKSLQHSVIDVQVPQLLAKLNIPLVFIHGDKDRVAPLENVKQLLLNLPQVPFYIFAGADHALPLTHTTAVADVVARRNIEDPALIR